MSSKAKLQKAKKKLKKTKAKLKSLKVAHQDLQEQFKTLSGPQQPLDPETVHSKLSKDIAAKQAIALFQTISEVAVIEAFTKGETRPSVVERAKFRINAIQKMQASE